MGRIKERDYTIFAVIKMAKDHAQGVTIDYDGRVPEFYKQIAKDEGRKVFYFSDKTMKRVENMDTSKLKAEDILPICHKAENRTGVVLASENYRRLCFGYTISDNQIIICAYRNSKSSMHSDNPDSVIRSIWLGTIVISESGVDITPSSLISGINALIKGANGVKLDKGDVPIVKRIMREVKQFPDAFSKEGMPGMVVFNPVTLSKDDRVPASKSEAMSHLFKYELLLTVLKMFLFLKTASVIQQTYISEGPANTYERGKREIRNYILVDSTWDGDITVLNPFSVRGHFRHQNKKDEKGEWYRDLIYIDAFMKKGYHRRATKIIERT